MKKHASFKPTLVALTVASVFGSYSATTYAQEANNQAQDNEYEVIEVSGIRRSLVQSMDIKRSSDGVVDAISAQDIGKFPDTNLAESLQRITGVSIDRQNNEGSRVTVRGWGPQYNLITLNGRQMPAANLSETTVNNDRSFDFANLAAESVSGVEVYKTGKAHITTGGIGATINILSHKPLSAPGMLANVAVKGIMDDTRIGDDITPEISGIFSNTFADDTIGISVVASRSVRDNFQGSGQVTSGWNSSLLTQDIVDGTGSPVIGADAGDVYSVPQNYMYRFEDFSRTRTNAQLTFQYAPSDKFKATLDYTYSEFDQDVNRQEFSAWFGGGAYSGTTFSEANSAGVVSPQVLNNLDGWELSFGVGEWGTKNEIDSLGLNLEWNVSDNLKFTFDAHSSTAEATPKDDRGSNNILTAVTPTRTSSTVDFTTTIPELRVNLSSPNGQIDPSTMILSGISMRDGYMKTEIDQYQFNGQYTFDDGIISSIDFGISHLTMNNRTAFSQNQGGNWGGVGFTGDSSEARSQGFWNSLAGDGDGNFSDEAFVVADLVDVPGSNLGAAGQMVWVDYGQFESDIAALYMRDPGLPGNVFQHCNPGTLCVAPDYQNDMRLEEEQLAFYAQANLVFDIGDKPAKLNLGVRHESTDVTANSLFPNYVTQVWSAGNEMILGQDGGLFESGENSYDYFLPNIDFQIDLTDDIVARASYSKSIARANYSQLQPATIPIGNQPRTFDASAANAGDPTLKPLESDNIDLSLEWYYGEGSYVSLGYYTKDVKNFIGTSIENRIIYPDLVNPASGARLAEAQAAVQDPTNAAVEIRNYYIAQGWIDASDGSLIGDTSVYDPLTYTVSVAINNEDATIDGFEFAAQHLFGESGFGVITNYTTVDGDVAYDDSAVGANQFALIGLSDSANLVGFYDKDGLQIRLAYNWRDEFLSSTTGGNNQFEPAYTEEYSQLDMSINYQVTEQLQLSLDAINLTEEERRVRARGTDAVIFAGEQSARYTLGLRYVFY